MISRLKEGFSFSPKCVHNCNTYRFVMPVFLFVPVAPSYREFYVLS